MLSMASYTDSFMRIVYVHVRLGIRFEFCVPLNENRMCYDEWDIVVDAEKVDLLYSAEEVHIFVFLRALGQCMRMLPEMK